jgi:RHS repeat-associated protein
MTVLDGLTNTWDFKDRLIAVENAEMRAEYVYDYTDRRIIKRVWSKMPTNSQTLTHIARATSVLYPDKHFEVREHDAPVKYVWNDHTRVARITGSLNTKQLVQHLRVWRGPNLVSLLITASNALSQLRNVNSETIEFAARWDQASLAWIPVAFNELIAAGTVLWLKAPTNAAVSITGSYAAPTNAPILSGISFIPVAGFDAFDLSNTPPGSISVWRYDAEKQRWQVRLSGDLPSQTDLPPSVSPGEVIFVQAYAAGRFAIPDSASRIRYYHQDHLGSSTVVIDSAGATLGENSYYPFGHGRYMEQRFTLGGGYGFTQKEMDPESGFHYFEARFFASPLSRFKSVDPIALVLRPMNLLHPQSANPYSYCANLPTVCTDPTGKEWQYQIGIGATVGGSMFLLTGPFIGGGTSIGFSKGESGTRLFVQFQANLMAGSGAYAGVGPQVAATHSKEPIHSGLNVEHFWHSEVNMGKGIANWGTGLDVNLKSQQLSLPPPNKLVPTRLSGVGFGVMAATGGSRQVTLATPTLNEMGGWTTRTYRNVVDKAATAYGQTLRSMESLIRQREMINQAFGGN